MTAVPISTILQTRLRCTGVIAVLVIDDAADAVPLARALIAGGIDCIDADAAHTGCARCFETHPC